MSIEERPGRGMQVGMMPRQESATAMPGAGPTPPGQFVNQQQVPQFPIGFPDKPGAVIQNAPAPPPFGGMGVTGAQPQFNMQASLMARLNDPTLSQDERLKLQNAIQLVGPQALGAQPSSGDQFPTTGPTPGIDPNVGSGGGGDGGGGSGGGDGGGGGGAGGGDGGL